jgi:hypothetical protein
VQFNVPKSTLLTKAKQGIVKAVMGRPTQLSSADEARLITWIHDCSAANCPRSRQEVIAAAARLARDAGNEFKKSSSASDSWWKRFKARAVKSGRPLTIRTPTYLNKRRQLASTEEHVLALFSHVAKTAEAHRIPAKNWFNFDESESRLCSSFHPRAAGFSTLQTNRCKVVVLSADAGYVKAAGNDGFSGHISLALAIGVDGIVPVSSLC